jgi:2-oxoglutarate ferredoxin oxidoreductase subunit alpha
MISLAAIDTAGNQPDVLIAMNPGGADGERRSVARGRLIIADEGEFTVRNLTKAGCEQSRSRTAACRNGRWFTSTFRS